MPSWPQLSQTANAALVAAFAEDAPATYQQGDQGTPFSLPIVRRNRERAESGGFAQLETVEVNPADFAKANTQPARGDWLTLAGGPQYVVTGISQLDPHGFISLSLMQGA